MFVIKLKDRQAVLKLLMETTMEQIRVIVNGSKGRMGQETVKAVSNDPQLKLVAQCGRQDDLAKIIAETHADVVVDFTTPSSVYQNARTIIAANARPVIGTTGLSPEQICELKQLAKANNLSGIIAPTFSLGVVMMMKFAREAANHFPDVEIIELHHDNKKDAPSGTAIKTAEIISESRHEIPVDKTENEIIAGARGAIKNNIHIHSIRLPGLVAHQEIIFGGHCETLTIRHDSIHRESFMPGVLLACKKVMALHELVYGMEYLI